MLFYLCPSPLGQKSGWCRGEGTGIKHSSRLVALSILSSITKTKMAARFGWKCRHCVQLFYRFVINFYCLAFLLLLKSSRIKNRRKCRAHLLPRHAATYVDREEKVLIEFLCPRELPLVRTFFFIYSNKFIIVIYLSFNNTLYIPYDRSTVFFIFSIIINIPSMVIDLIYIYVPLSIINFPAFSYQHENIIRIGTYAE